MRTETPVQVKLEDYTPYPFAIDQVELSFELSPSDTRVVAKMQVRRLGEAAADMVLDGEKMVLEAIKLDGQALRESDYAVTENTLTLHTPPASFELEITVRIDPSKNTELSGLYISGGRFCTQCESVGFRRITYWPDRPDVMSRFKVRLEADAEAYPVLLSNGTPGEAGELDGGRHFAVWDDPHPKPSYLFALCAGDYDIYRDSFTTMSGKSIDLAVHVDKGDADRAVWAMESLKASMRWDEEVFAREYDLGVFNIVAVRDFNFGAMENKGLNVFNSAYVLADEATATDFDFEAIESIVGHEYFHNWTGNRITCRDWFQLCLKEGLTVFRDQEFSADMRSRPVQRIKDVIRLRSRQFPEDAGPLAHAVRPDHYGAIDNLYTATVYEKGAELIRMLKTMIGDNAFAKGMQIYFERHDGEATTIETFYKCFEDASNEDLSDFRRWYSQPGTPTLSIEEHWDSKAGSLAVQITQTNPETPGNASPTALPMPLRVAAFSSAGEQVAEETIRIDGKVTTWVIDGQSGRPLVSVNRGFSAPVRINRDLSSDQLLALAKVDDDPFNQWDSLQSLLKADLLAIAYDGKNSPDKRLIRSVADAVRAHIDDPAFAALLTGLPTVGEIFLDRKPADAQALDQARKSLQTELAMALQDTAQDILAAASPAPFNPGAAQAGTRALRAAMIALTGALKTPEASRRLKTIFDEAPNMTESLATLRALSRIDRDEARLAMAAFEQKWAENDLVMDKWFAVQAGAADADGIKQLMSHKLFSMDNPNRVRSVLAVFAMQNLPEFHAPDGSGYKVVADAIAAADKLNPALAARLLTAFEHWTSVVPDTRAKAKMALQTLKDANLSKNAADIITRTLA